MRILARGKVAAGNFREGRTDERTGRAWTPDVIVIHVTEGSAASALDWFADPASHVSSHYLVKKDGGIVPLVPEGDTAFVNGVVDRPRSEIVTGRPAVNPNFYTIGIEHEGSGREPLTDAQREASGELIADIAARRGIPIDSDHVIPHNWIRRSKSCPGAIDVADLIVEAESAALARPDPPRVRVAPPDPPLSVWSDYFAERFEGDGWLVVTYVRSDAEWYFVPMGMLDGPGVTRVAVERGSTPLSKMPRHPPARPLDT